MIPQTDLPERVDKPVLPRALPDQYVPKIPAHPVIGPKAIDKDWQVLQQVHVSEAPRGSNDKFKVSFKVSFKVIKFQVSTFQKEA